MNEQQLKAIQQAIQKIESGTYKTIQTEEFGSTEFSVIINSLNELAHHLESKRREEEIMNSNANHHELELISKDLANFKFALDESAIVAITDIKGDITYVNDKFCEISKYSRKELIGQNHRIINSGHHSLDFFKELWKTIKNGDVWRGKIRNKAKDGSYYWVATTIVPFLNDKGKAEQYVSIRFDITDQVDYAIELEGKNSDLAQFAYVVSHDLKAPVRGIVSLIGFVNKDLEMAKIQLPEEVNEQLQLIKERTLRMDQLINGLLQFGRIGSNKTKELFPIEEIIDEVLKFSSIPFHFKVIKNSSYPLILANRTEIFQIFHNLIDNAVKYSDKHQGKLWIDWKQDDNDTIFTFKDNGIGIDKQYHSKIFQIFQTLQKGINLESTGIGLSIVKKIVNSYYGTIYVESSKDKGAAFIIRLPSYMFSDNNATALKTNLKNSKLD